MIKRSHVAAIHDISMAGISFVLSLWLRLGHDFYKAESYLLSGTVLFMTVCACVFLAMALYRGVWRYASTNDLIAITKAVTVATLFFVPIMFLLTRLEDFPRSVIIINWFVLLALLGGPRFLYRALKDRGLIFPNDPEYSEHNGAKTPVILAGISETSVHFLRECAKPSSPYEVLGIIDAKPSTIGSYIHDVKVYGNYDNFEKVLEKITSRAAQPKQLVIGSDELNGTVVRTLMRQAEEYDIALSKLPKLTDFKHSDQVLALKPIAIEDLLGRPQNKPAQGRRHELIAGKTVLITGAGGTIGSELTRQLAALSPSRIILFELCEFNLYKISEELNALNIDAAIEPLIGDIRDANKIDQVFKEFTPELVFHAAALKHVPIVENNLCEAVLTNIIGTQNVANMCAKHHVSHMVSISTDKAVNPSSLMGVTKRIAELYIQTMQAKTKCKTHFSMVRFGNVLGSSGSVIPLFQKQLEQGGPITITHPEMNRYFMTVPEAVELVLQASTINRDAQPTGLSDIFVLDMGEPVKILDLANQMIKLSGLTPNEDIAIEFIGMRPGEKLYEELFYNDESQETTRYDGIFLAQTKTPFAQPKLAKMIEELVSVCDKHDVETLKQRLQSLVPEYNPNPDSQEAA